MVERSRIKVCVLRVGGTNCDEETRLAFEDLGVQAEVVHMNWVLSGKKKLLDYHVIVFPGGFSYGDYVRAGAIWGKRVAARLREDLEEAVRMGLAIVGICNGFQVLIESGLLPGLDRIGGEPRASLAVNDSARYECRWVYLRCVDSCCKLTRYVPRDRVLRIPVGHGEGKFTAPDDVLREMLVRRMIVFRYAKPDGSLAEGEYPYNPNGSVLDIAGITNPQGNVLGMMPHPERAYWGWQLPDWTRMAEPPVYGDGRLILESIVRYAEEEL